MAKYRVVEKSYIGGKIVDVGETVDVEFTDGGTAGPNLQALDAPKKGKKSAATAVADGEQTGDLT